MRVMRRRAAECNCDDEKTPDSGLKTLFEYRNLPAHTSVKGLVVHVVTLPSGRSIWKGVDSARRPNSRHGERGCEVQPARRCVSSVAIRRGSALQPELPTCRARTVPSNESRRRRIFLLTAYRDCCKLFL
jgi:hypothetical protein